MVLWCGAGMRESQFVRFRALPPDRMAASSLCGSGNGRAAPHMGGRTQAVPFRIMPFDLA
jgi:hypothetical protein